MDLSCIARSLIVFSALLLIGFILLSCTITAPQRNSFPIICITFDDQDYSQWDNALPLMQSYGYRGTAFVNSALVGNVNKMSIAEVQSLAMDYGWEIGGHTTHHIPLASLTPDAAELSIVSDYDTIKSWGIMPYSFALPAGHCPQYLYPTLKRLYKNVRGSSDFSMKKPLDRYRLGYLPWQSGWNYKVPADRILRGIKDGDELIIIGFHSFRELSGSMPTNCPPQDFEKFLQWLSQRGLRVLPLHEAITAL